MQKRMQEWFQQHPRWQALYAVVLWLVVVGVGVSLGIRMWHGEPTNWAALQTDYQYAGGWTLSVVQPMGPPVPVEYYANQTSCEDARAEEITRAYHDNTPIQPLSCVARYQGWRRLLYVYREDGRRARHAEVVK